MKNGPLSGLRVIDIGMILAGPLVSANLGDLGADIIKIELPRGDEFRKVGRQKNDKGLWWRVTSRNKRLLALDVSKTQGAEIFKRLAKNADIVIENFRPQRMDKWGLSYSELSKINPGLIMLHISGYGQSGPYVDRPGLGTLAEAMSGFSFGTGEENGPPTLPQYPIADTVTAMIGAYSVLAAVYAREKNGGIGDEINLNLFESMISLMGSMIIDYDQLGHLSHRKGNRSTWSVPRNAYRTMDDKWVVIAGAVNSVAMNAFRAIGRDDLANDPGLATNPQRVERIDECDNAMADWISKHNLDFVLEHFHKFNVVVGPIYDISQIVKDPQIKHQGTILDIKDDELGSIKLQNVVPHFTNNPGKIRWAGSPIVGKDTFDILGELGYSQAEIHELEKSEIIKTNSLN